MIVRGPRSVGICAIKHRDGGAESLSKRPSVDADIHIKLSLAREQAGDYAQIRARVVRAYGLDDRWSVFLPVRTQIGDELLA